MKEGHCPSSHYLSQQRQLALHTGKSLTVPGSASQELSKAPNSPFHQRKRNTLTTKLNKLREQACAFYHKTQQKSSVLHRNHGRRLTELSAKDRASVRSLRWKSSLLHFMPKATPSLFPHHPSPHTHHPWLIWRLRDINPTLSAPSTKPRPMQSTFCPIARYSCCSPASRKGSANLRQVC